MDNTPRDINYLQELLAHVSIIKNKVKYKAIIPDSFSVTYMATKKESFIGRKSGYAEQLLRIEKGNQIVYECYLNETKACVDYYFINYVKDGKYPILEKRKGIFRFAPLRYENIEIESWLEY